MRSHVSRILKFSLKMDFKVKCSIHYESFFVV